MSFARDLLQHPRRLVLRRVVFQVHLWMGLLAALYLVLIALSGSVLVYKDELTRLMLPPALQHRVPHIDEVAAPLAVVQRFRGEEPRATLNNLQVPTAVYPAFLLTGQDAAGRPARWISDPVTGHAQPAPRTWLDAVHDFHYYLLLPPAWGMQANAVGAAFLLLLLATGLVLWWPGLRLWSRGLRINLRASWRRVNYDMHNALGFWTLPIMAWWALSGVYFGWYRQVSAVVQAISPLRGMVSPAPGNLPAPPAGVHASLPEVLRAAQATSPGGHLWSISDPQLRSPESFVLLDRGAPGDFSHRDIVRVRSADARVVSVWHYGERHTLGDWVLWSMHPLHFGTLWGPWIKLAWALLGLALAVLTVTGVLMYWNRYLRSRWTKLRAP